jgi:hypothetical protein
VILNNNVQSKRHKDSNKEHSWIIFMGEFTGGASVFMGEFTGGALCFDDRSCFEEQHKWHKFDGHQYNWNEPHEGEKFSIVLYRNGAKKTKVQQITDAKKKRVGKEQEEGRPERADLNIDGLVEEFRQMLAKLLAASKERIENIPVPG